MFRGLGVRISGDRRVIQRPIHCRGTNDTGRPFHTTSNVLLLRRWPLFHVAILHHDVVISFHT